MSLATRCTACGTTFRVVQDQLKVSEGWVRCGRCDEVFNALEGLFDLGRDASSNESIAEPPQVRAEQQANAEPPQVRAERQAIAEPRALAESQAPSDAPVPQDIDPSTTQGDPSTLEPIDMDWPGPRRTESDSTPADRVSECDRLEFPDAQFDPESMAGAASRPDDAPLPTANDESEGDPAQRHDAPEFMRQAQREARWREPRVQAALGLSAIALLLMLVAQGGHHFRDLAAARWPAARPTLVAWCELVGCTIGAPRRIDDISVESTALTPTSAGDAFALGMVLRNRGAMTVALPSVDLSLTSATGQLIARRILTPSDFRVASELMPPGSEASLQLVLTAGNVPVMGYTVEIFHP